MKITWGLLIIAVIGDFLVPYLLASSYKGYSHKKQVMSVLGNPDSPVRTVYNIWLMILGILLAISTWNDAMRKINYNKDRQQESILPNGKKFVRIDFNR